MAHLVGAFHALLQVHPTARLLLAGDGPDRAARSRRPVEALRLGPFVRFLGTLADPWPLLAAADIFALPSLWEGMPNALLEAMAAGLPAVATAVGAVPEMVVDGREALVVPPGDAGALARALAELAACAGAAARDGGARPAARRGRLPDRGDRGADRAALRRTARGAGPRRMSPPLAFHACGRYFPCGLHQRAH